MPKPDMLEKIVDAAEDETISKRQIDIEKCRTVQLLLHDHGVYDIRQQHRKEGHAVASVV
jgi:hypothetical protein